MVNVKSSSNVEPERDERVFMHAVTWETYEALLEDRGESAIPRLSYLDGELELMSPTHYHERIKETLGALCVYYCFERGITIQALGSWTVRRRKKKAGAEADCCYVFARGEPIRPDLAIEVVWTSGGIDKLEIWRRLGVPEVWVWEDGVIGIYAMQEGQYQLQPRSQFLPEFPLALASELVQLEAITDALARWRDALRA